MRASIGVTLTLDKMQENRLKWLIHVFWREETNSEIKHSSDTNN